MNKQRLPKNNVDDFISVLANKLNQKVEFVDTLEYFKSILPKDELKLIHCLDCKQLEIVKKYHIVGEPIGYAFLLAERYGDDDVITYYLWDKKESKYT